MAGTAYGVLVGYDGSGGSDRALSWAVREAKSRGTVLTVCPAWNEWYEAIPGSAPPPGDGVADHAKRAAEQVAAEGWRAARDLLGGQNVRLLVVYGSPAGVLCDHSAAADMVVVGSRGRGGLSGLRRSRCCGRSRPAARVPRCWPRRTAPRCWWWAPAGGAASGECRSARSATRC
jgi:nucleotide-binding universal stress UspA family protein